MSIFMNRALNRVGILGMLSSIIVTTGCSSRSLPQGAVAGGQYNYSPSVIQNGNTRQIWWCSKGVEPERQVPGYGCDLLRIDQHVNA